MDTQVELSPDAAEETARASALHAALSSVNPLTVPVMSRIRHIPRKEQAKLARALFRRLGLKGISVTTPSYSMAQVVDIRLPRRRDHKLDAYGFPVVGDAASTANNEARRRMETILLAAFPNHDNRSDYQTDYFDHCWSIA